MCGSMPSIEAEERPLVHVAVAVISNAQREVLLTLRHPNSHQGGLWEFPGGKWEAGESLAAALRREILEELGVEVRRHEAMIQVEHDYGDKQVCLDVHHVTQYTGDPEPREGQPMRWVPISELHKYAFPEANQPIVKQVQARL